MMRIIIDMQGAQSLGSRDRGIGRYSYSLAKAIARNRDKHEILLVLSGLFPETVESIRKEFNDLLPSESIQVWYAQPSVNSLDINNNWRRKAAELVRETFIASLKPDVVLVTSLLEGLTDDAVTSVGMLSQNILTATILYDLIPLIYRENYLADTNVANWYEEKLEHMKRSDILLGISESSCQEAINHLGFSEQATFNISAAVEQQFHPIFISEHEKTDTLQRYKLHKPFVMYTGGIDHRKNIEGLIRAYASLPLALRIKHQLAVVCSIKEQDIIRLEELAKELGLDRAELVFTGYIPEDDLVKLYNLCKMFVFPSLHEGFGLPVLEAMSCGKPVIGTNVSSIPEVIGREDALFSLNNDKELARKLEEVLNDEPYRDELAHHSLEQAKKFSWDLSAKRAISAMEQATKIKDKKSNIATVLGSKPKMAYISPLPPLRSGISDYSAELLPELSQYFDIDVIVEQELITNSWINENCQVRSEEWLREHKNSYERVIYHFGNSEFHQHMFSLIKEIPGIVILHDFFLSGVVAHMDFQYSQPNGWALELYNSHGYYAVKDRFSTEELSDVVYKYPCNLSILRDAIGVIVHSESSRKLAKSWYTSNEADAWALIPLLRVPKKQIEVKAARKELNLQADDFVICSFGMIGATKLNHRLLEAWLSSELANNKHCVLIFVGENDTGDYGQNLLKSIKDSGVADRIRISEWVDTETYHNYLAAADIGVQLRTESRGETSAAVLDCMNYGLPTIVNANGSMADLDDTAVWKLPDEFSSENLSTAMETLWNNHDVRTQIGGRATQVILNSHEPKACAKQYFDTIEDFYQDSNAEMNSLTQKIAQIEPFPVDYRSIMPLAAAMAKSFPPKFSAKQLLVDISALVMEVDNQDLVEIYKDKLLDLLSKPSSNYRVEPIYAQEKNIYRYARNFTMSLLDCPGNVFVDEVVEFRSGDTFLQLGSLKSDEESMEVLYKELRNIGIDIKKGDSNDCW